MDKLSVAIVGLGCIFPKSNGLKEYWRLLYRGEDAITDIPESHFSIEDYYDSDPKKPDHIYCKRGGFLSPVSFDPTEFGIPPSVLEATDSAQLLSLLIAKNAIEDAVNGNENTFKRDRTSVILGVTGTQELVIPLGARLGHPIWRKSLESSGISPEKSREVIQKISDAYVSWQENSFPGLLGNVVAGRISNRLNLGGTNCVVDAACASSLSAVHLAVLELLSGRCDVVVTGGVDALNDIFMHMCFSKTMVLSSSGNARPFSKEADGTVLGEGIGMFVLKRLEDAQKDGNKIYAVLRGIGSSSDGKSQSIYAPRAEGQLKALQAAYEQAGIDPATIELIEAHGTGTRVGDLVEFQALNRLFGQSRKNGRHCAIGSVKSMIGHTKAAAGAAGLMKAVLSLFHKVLPPTLKADEPDPKLNIDQSPFYLNTKSRPWFSKKDHPRRSGVSAFGFGGSNFHVVLEEYHSDKTEISWDGSVEILALSASVPDQIQKQLQSFRTAVDQGASFDEIALQAAQTRQNFSAKDPCRFLVVLERHADLSQLLDRAANMLESNQTKTSADAKNIFYGRSNAAGKIALVFPGQGSQYVGMGSDLVCSFPKAFKMLEYANEKYSPWGRLTDFIYPLPGHNREAEQYQEEALRKTDVAQPAIGALSLAMLQILQDFDIQADAVCGHSFGELSALCAAGWIDVDTFLNLAILRGRLMAATAGNVEQTNGSMLAVKAPLNQIEDLIQKTDTGVILANRNSPLQGVLSGSIEAINKVESLCKTKGFKTVRLPVSAAFHSHLVKDAQKPFQQALQEVDVHPTAIPVFSNTTGQAYPQDAEATKKLLGEHLLRPVDFLNDIENLYASGVRTFVEVGPKSILTGLIQTILKKQGAVAIALDDSAGRQSGTADLARLLCCVASQGHFVSLKQWEQPIRKTRKPIMSIPIAGANYRSTPDKPPKTKASAPQPKSELFESQPGIPVSDPIRNGFSSLRESGLEKYVPEKAAEATPLISKPNQAAFLEQPSNKKEMKHRIHIKQQDVMKNDSQQNFIQDALKVVQEGLKSMQALQMQTAEAHQKFLETQTEASRILQEMMQNTRRLAEASLGIDNSDFRVPRTDAFTEVPVHHRKPQILTGPDTVQDLSHQVDVKPIKNEPPIPSESRNHNHLKDSLLEVVSHLTGYPLEMLALDMDIEADLGIDSIKRVEILSTLEEKITGLPFVSPEIMGSLKTLGQIVEYLSDKADNNQPEQPEFSSSESPLIDHSALKTNLLEVVSHLTGYPLEMLALDMDIEADLGIDSIKRVEILSTLEEKIPGLPNVSPEIMGSLKTLGQIVDYLSTSAKAKEPNEKEEDIPAAIAELDAQPQEDNDGLSKIGIENISRNIVSIVEKPFLPGHRLALPFDRKMIITDDQSGLSQALVQAFSSRGVAATLVSRSWITELRHQRRALSKACGLIIVAPNSADTISEHEQPDDLFLKDSFWLTQCLAPDLLDTAGTATTILATVTRLDGAFGFKGRGMINPLQGGLAGLVKTANLEWDSVCCRAFDVAPDWKDDQSIAQNIVSELLHADATDPVEIGLDSNSRINLVLEPAPYPTGDLNLEPNDVVVITGGARGVTAYAARALSEDTRPTLILLGRSPLPAPEPQWLKGLEDETAVKKAIFENEFKGVQATPIQLENTFKKHMANREIFENIEKMRQCGAEVYYHSVDIRDGEKVATILDEVRSTFGPIKGVIHAAGVLEDRRIIEKTFEQFESVFDPKVKGLKGILAATRKDPLKYLILFSSVTARIGNYGQVDYAMANEVLNKIAQQEAVARPECRVISINWGPWEGGMVCSALKRKFQRDGIQLIPLKAGAQCMIREMAANNQMPVEVVIGAGFIPEKQKALNTVPNESPLPHPPRSIKAKPKLALTFTRDIDVDQYPILNDHILDGKPVVPFALITEWLGHGALHENPGLVLCGLDNMRILQGIKLDQHKKQIRLMAGKAVKKGGVYLVDVEIRDGVYNNHETTHSHATAVLTDQLDVPPVFSPAKDIAAKNYFRSMEEVYEKILFHGHALRGIQEIIGYSSGGIMARVAAAPSPVEWMKDPLRSKWIGDPLALDSAFQMAILWCFEELSMVCLPSYSASYRQYRRNFPDSGVTVALEVKDVSRHKIKGDFTFLDDQDTVVARLTGYEAIMDASLSRAFKSQHAA